METRCSNAELVDQYLDYMTEHQRRATTTVYKYRSSYVSLLEVLEARGVHLGAASKDDLLAWLDRPRTKLRGDRLSDASLHREIMVLRSLFKYLDEKREPRGILGRNPAKMLEAPTVHNEDPHPVPDEMWLRLWTADLPDDERVAFGLAYWCGLRRAEVTGLSASQFVDHPSPRIVGLVRKGGYRQGVPFVSAATMAMRHRPDLIVDAGLFTDAVRRLVAVRSTSPSLLPWRDDRLSSSRRGAHATLVNPDRFNRRLARRLVSVGLEPRAFTPHAMRHSFCTNLIDWGMPIETVAELAGHSSVDITRRYVRVHSDPFAAFMAADAGVPAQRATLRPRARFG